MDRLDAEVSSDVGELSTHDLVERAARLGPARPTMLSIALPDPILREKVKPRVAERRARFTRVVKGALGACLLLCVAAIATSALADDTTSSKSANSVVTTQGVRAAFVPSIEGFDNAKRTKASRQQRAFVAPHKTKHH